MKISKLFHWLYASLMLLPFASVVSTTLYYSFNKNAVIPQVDKVISREVDFNQQFDFEQSRQWYLNGTGSITYDINSVTFSNTSEGLNSVYTSFDFDDNSIYYLSCIASSSSGGSIEFGWHTGYYNSFTNLTSTPQKVSNISYLTTSGSVYFYVYNTGFATDINISYINLINLTKMFGAGNEPTLQEFNDWFSNQYYDYTLSEHIIIPNYETIQVADSSINHFWLPSFGAIGYNIQSYIGWVIGNVFGLNVVNGIGFVIVRLFTYWLIISICWLIFDVLMYVPNLVHKWLDKAAID